MLEPDDIEAIAQRVAELLRGDHAAPELVDAAAVAAALQISRDTVYRHKRALGGRPIGDSRRPRWRFDLSRALASRESLPAEPASEPPATKRRRRSTSSRVELLPIRGQAA